MLLRSRCEIEAIRTRFPVYVRVTHMHRDHLWMSEPIVIEEAGFQHVFQSQMPGMSQTVF